MLQAAWASNIAAMFNLLKLIQIIEILGILAFAFSGFLEARRKDMDLVGVFTVAFITAF